MHCFVNLPLSRALPLESGLFPLFLSGAIRPELGLDAAILDGKDEDWFRRVRDLLDEASLDCSVHLPFFHLLPGATDPLIREASLTRLARGMKIARLLRPRLMIGHAAACRDFPEKWLKLSLASWNSLLDQWPDHPPLYLENTFEQDPDPLVRLMSGMDRERVGICLDVGHWHCFARGAERKDLDRWITSLAPFLKHLHLHDNDGAGDQHVGLGQGTIPFGQLTELLAAHGLTPTATLEPHSEAAFAASMDAATSDPAIASLFSRIAPA